MVTGMNYLLKAYVTVFLYLGKERTLYLYGMRRSGNHACIGWLINSLEGKNVEYTNTVNHYLNVSDSGKTVFLNEVNMIDGKEYLGLLWSNRKVILAAKYIIVSAEDVMPTYKENFRVPKHDTCIKVTRSTLNLLSSRFQNINRKARSGIGWSRQNIDSNFFRILTKLHDSSDLCWNFDKWAADPDWRMSFLKGITLHADIIPGVASEGGGSSFGGDSGNAQDSQVFDRLSLVQPKMDFIKLLERAVYKYPNLFEETELKRISKEFSKHDFKGESV